MITAKKNGQLDTYFGHFLGPYIVCGGNVEVWDQTLGCPECGKELWTGKTSVLEFDAEHPFMFCDAHDDGDECEWADDSNDAPLGGWRYPHYTPQWWSGARPYQFMPWFRVGDEYPATEHVLPDDMRTNHDPGDE